MYKMFANCFNLISVNGISKLKKIKLNNLNKMFYNCISLSSIPDISDWDISKVINVEYTFSECFSVKEIYFNTNSYPKVKKIQYMF